MSCLIQTVVTAGSFWMTLLGKIKSWHTISVSKFISEFYLLVKCQSLGIPKVGLGLSHNLGSKWGFLWIPCNLCWGVGWGGERGVWGWGEPGSLSCLTLCWSCWLVLKQVLSINDLLEMVDHQAKESSLFPPLITKMSNILISFKVVVFKIYVFLINRLNIQKSN